MNNILNKQIKELEENQEKIFSDFNKLGIKILVCYKCIYCGKIFDDMKGIIYHNILDNCNCKNEIQNK